MALRNREQETTVHLQERASVLQDVDDVVASTKQQEQQVQGNGSKMAHAKQVNRKSVAELQSLCSGLTEMVSEIGIQVEDAQQFHGRERLFNFLGKMGSKRAKEHAAVLRHDRLQTLTMEAAVKEIQTHVENCIAIMGTSEQELRMDHSLYRSNIDMMLAKLKEATPKYVAAQASKATLEAEVQSLDEELKAGTLSQMERPAKLAALEQKQRQLDRVILEEKTLAAIVKQAQEGLPEVQKSDRSAVADIQSIHSMRQDILEKFANFKVVLERASTAVKARARIELYTSVDPAFNKTIQIITENNVATCGAILEAEAERIKHAAIDPETSQRLLQELLGHITQAAKSLQDTEARIKAGPPSGAAQPEPDSAPYPNGHDTTGDNANEL